VVDDARAGTGVAAYRGFLFADMRGFTAFGERHGNAAAATAVRRFLDIARTAISRHHGAEIKTEGDAIHAVFPSASSAVLCGLDIVDGAAELNAQEPDRPLGIGVGVHAGEAVETAEGYIGRAVNIAARLCSAAKPGEVLVSSTVKGITQASIQVGFIPRGKRRLKGIEDPVVVYSVTRDVNATAQRDMTSWTRLGAAALGAVAVVAIVVTAGSMLLGNPAGSPGSSKASSASAGPTAQPAVIGALALGTYRSREFQPPITFRIADQGWAAQRDHPELFGLVREVAPLGNLYMLRVQEVLANPCVEGGEGQGAQTGPGALSLLTQVENLQHLDVTERVPVAVGGHPGHQVDITIDESVLAACAGLAGGEVPLFFAGEEVWRASPGELFRLISVDVGGQAVAIAISADWSRPPSVPEWERLLQQCRRILDDVQFSGVEAT
jgi:class 3 adenylate cyclase